MATHSSILDWRIPWTEEPGGLQSTGSQRVRHDWSNLAHIVNALEKILMLGNIEDKRRRRWPRMRWLASLTQ